MVDGTRARVFGATAARYEEFRPSYPPAVVDILVERQPRDAVDVGCGTGKATRLVAGRGVDVIGVEPDDRMAEVARTHGITVETSSIEEWMSTPRDLVFAAQSWHWVDPDRGAVQVGATLRSGGRFAAFWNEESDPDLNARVRAVYAGACPVPEPRPRSSGRLTDELAASFGALERFGPVVRQDVEWTDHITADTYVARASTWSAHALLDRGVAADVESQLLAELGGVDAPLAVEYSTMVLVVDRM